MDIKEKNNGKINTNLILLAIVLLFFIANLALFYRTLKLQQDIKRLYDSFVSSSNANFPENYLEIGSLAPEFNENSIGNKQIALDDFRGERFLLVFASTECSACQSMFPNLKEFININSNIKVVMAINGSKDRIISVIDTYQFDFPVLNPNEEFIQSYKVMGVPFFYFIDENGYILNASFANTLDQLEGLVK